jgi:2-isopropylmalate synthase
MKIKIYDSTLRDGAQGSNISFSVDDKLNIVKVLDDLGIDYIEAGNPFSSPSEQQFFQEIKKSPLKHSILVAFGSTRRKNIECDSDMNLKSLLDADTSCIAIFGKSSSMHVTDVLKTTLEENLAMIYDSVKYMKDKNKEVVYDAEHFFDGYNCNSEYALKTLEAAVNGGADWICLCDTNGGMFAEDIANVTSIVKNRFPSAKIAIHCHNDSGLAVANSIAAINVGATSIQGTFLGFGERCGNTNLTTAICNLQLKKNYDCIPSEQLINIYESSVKIAEITNISIDKNEPYIGISAFAHKAGMHADGVLKASGTFEHIDPELIGNKRKFLLSEMSGKSAVLSKIKNYFPEIDRNSPEIDKILASLKEYAQLGYQYEAAEASFILKVKQILGQHTPCFELISFKIINEQPAIEGKVASAILKIRVGNETRMAASDGDGPVHAIDLALRSVLSEFYPIIKKVSLNDYKVRVLDSDKATAANVRVLITSTDGKDVWTTVGVSGDIIQASWIALTDSIEYTLMKNNF